MSTSMFFERTDAYHTVCISDIPMSCRGMGAGRWCERRGERGARRPPCVRAAAAHQLDLLLGREVLFDLRLQPAEEEGAEDLVQLREDVGGLRLGPLEVEPLVELRGGEHGER